MDQSVVVRLAPGEVAFYDPFTQIHLTIGNPSVTIGKGKNLTNIRRSVKSRRLLLVAGSLDPVAPVVSHVIAEVPVIAETPVPVVEAPASAEEIITEAVEMELPIMEEPVIETEEAADEIEAEQDPEPEQEAPQEDAADSASEKAMPVSGRKKRSRVEH